MQKGNSISIRSPLLHLALLETLKSDEILDEIDLFLPFIAVTASEIEKATITDTDIQNKLFESFGFRPPQSAIKVLMSRAKKRGLFKRENYAFIPVHEKITEWKNGYEHKKDDLEISLKSLKQEFVEFTKSKFDKVISSDEAEKLILGFIEENVSSVISDRAFNKAELSGNIKNTDHIIASFISLMHRTQPLMLEHFSRCVKGMLLANYLFYADKADSKKKYDGISIFLDSPLVIGLLGYSGKQKQQALQEFLDLLKSLSIGVNIFERTQYEIEGLLSAWRNDLAKNSYKRFNTKTLEWLKSQHYDAERLETELKLLSSSIEKLGIKISQGFQSKEKFQCDEPALEQAISKNFKKDKDLEHDTICISRVHNLREGKVIKGLSQKFSIFVTPNTGLVRVANQYFENEIGKDSIPVVASEQWITAMFWLKKPDIFGSLPMDQLVATAYSLLYTDDRFWNAFIRRLETIEKRGGITEEQFVQVRWDSDLLRLVHDVSVDVGEDFSEEDIFDIVEKIKSKNEAQAKQQIEALKAQSAEEIEQARSSASREIAALKAEKGASDTQLAKIDGKIRKSIDVFSNIVAWSFSIFLLSVLVFIGLSAIPNEYLPKLLSTDAPKGKLYLCGAILTLVFGLLSNAVGIDIAFFHKRIKVFLSKKLSNLMLD